MTLIQLGDTLRFQLRLCGYPRLICRPWFQKVFVSSRLLQTFIDILVRPDMICEIADGIELLLESGLGWEFCIRLSEGLFVKIKVGLAIRSAQCQSEYTRKPHTSVKC
jgi:hypothetical protein